MTDTADGSGNLPDDMAEYLQMFIDEAEEQLDDLVETMLALERDSTNKDDLNEAFRLIHSLKGAAGMMGFDNITVLTHHLENRFERFRSGTARLDDPTMGLVLRCIDFLRQCNNRLRAGERLGSSAELLNELKGLEEHGDRSSVEEPKRPADQSSAATAADAGGSPSPPSSHEHDSGDALVRLLVRFRPGLQLADLKAQLIVARLSGSGEVRATQPDLAQLAEVARLDEFSILIETHEDLDCLRSAADVDGVESIEFPGAATESIIGATAEGAVDSADSTAHENTPLTAAVAAGSEQHADDDEPDISSPEPAAAPHRHAAAPLPATAGNPATKVSETMRVDIDRLDRLLNLAGELVVNRARLVQISGQISPALRKATMLNRIRDFSDGLRRMIASLENSDGDLSDRAAQIQQLRSGLELMDEQADVWENGRRCLGEIGEAIDQLSRVSHSLQRGVLDTRMVPVGPLFNRFKRVVRDLSKERGKRVNLLIRGEKTELDKRMIDELGDPLVHLVRNSIDHGLEPPEVRVSRGKPEVGTICLEASHSGHNVYIHVRDDGGGIDAGRIKARLIDKGILSRTAAEELSDEQAVDYIWHPGFSTAKEVTDVSGRGVGMDVVKTRINLLNGTIEVDSAPHRGTTFTLRLPLTLAIIDCLLVRLRSVIFSMPIDDVKEIVSVRERDIVTFQGKQTFDVRGEFLPLISIDEVFYWHGVDYGHRRKKDKGESDSNSETVEVVILHAGGKTLGLRVDELLGSQDIVIKSLADNFMDIPGLSGASTLGDGSVCLMLDVGTVIDRATQPSCTSKTEGVAT